MVVKTRMRTEMIPMMISSLDDRGKQARRVLRDDGAHRVLEDGQLAEEGVLLEGAPQPQGGQVPSRHAGHAAAVEIHLAPVGHAASDGREAATLAGPVGADDSEDPPRLHLPRHALQRHEGPVADGEALRFARHRL